MTVKECKKQNQTITAMKCPGRTQLTIAGMKAESVFPLNNNALFLLTLTIFYMYFRVFS